MRCFVSCRKRTVVYLHEGGEICRKCIQIKKCRFFEIRIGPHQSLFLKRGEGAERVGRFFFCFFGC